MSMSIGAATPVATRSSSNDEAKQQLIADRQAARQAAAQLDQANSQLQADEKAKASEAVLKRDQQAIDAAEAAKSTADAKVQSGEQTLGNQVDVTV